MSIAERLELIRAFMGVLQKTLAKRLKVSQRAYSDYLNGKRLPSSNMLCELAEEGFDVTWLLSGKTPRIQGAPEGVWIEKPPVFSVPEKDSWLLDEEFMAELVEGIARSRESASAHLPPAELGRMAARLSADIAAVSHSAEQRDAALKMALLQLRRQKSE